MIVFERRASTVLFGLLRSHQQGGGPYLLPANVCPIVPLVFLKARRPFEFVDISADTLCMDHDAVIARWTREESRPAGLVYVRTYGALHEEDGFLSRIKALSPSALIIDDRCLCRPDFGTELAPGVDVALFSSGYAKYADIGFGGFAKLGPGVRYHFSRSAFSADAHRALITSYKAALARRESFAYEDTDWLDTRVPDITFGEYQDRVEEAALLAERHKAALNAVYSEQVPEPAQLPAVFQNWRFNIRVSDKAAVLRRVEEAGLFASGHYDSLAGVFGPGVAPQCEDLHRGVINLFNDRYFSLDAAAAAARAIAHAGGATAQELRS